MIYVAVCDSVCNSVEMKYALWYNSPMRIIRRIFKWLAIGLAVAVILLAVAVPFATPPLVRLVAERKLAEMGFPSRVDVELGYVWRGGPELAGRIGVAVDGSPWRADAEFGAGLGRWHASVAVPRTEFTEGDPVVADLLRRYPLESVTNLAFTGIFAATATVERTSSLPIPVWRAYAPIRIREASMVLDDTPVAIGEFAVVPGASGLADHVDIAPLFPRARSLSFGGFDFTNVFASVRATEKSLMVNEAGAGFCGGRVSLYSLFLDPNTLNAGLTLFIEDVDAGEILSHLNAFNGTATGRLQGKFRLFAKEGGASLRVREAFLHSIPGEGGKIMMSRPETLTDNLAFAGVGEEARRNLANALTDLDYSVLRLDLKRAGRNLNTLSVLIDGSATRGKTTVPVNVGININGSGIRV